jgi:transcriptional regulator with XRE-family HTH domain
LKLGEFIKEERLNRGLTQTELANQLGVSYVTVNKLENRNHCGVKTLLALSLFLGVSLTELRSYMNNHENH